MNLSPSSHRLRRFAMLAPPGANLARFTEVFGDRRVHGEFLRAVQRFRGQVYLAEGNLKAADLRSDGRHEQPADQQSWHVLGLTASGKVASCARICLYARDAVFSDLMVSHAALAHSAFWGDKVRRAIEDELAAARYNGTRFAEFGGWAIARGLRCTTEAIRMLLAGYTLGEAIGGVSGISTVNLRHHSASILRRIGGRPLESNGTELPSYYEPRYASELEILRFDSRHPNERYRSRIDECRAVLENVMVISPTPTARRVPEQLQGWLAGAAQGSAEPTRDWQLVPHLVSHVVGRGVYGQRCPLSRLSSCSSAKGFRMKHSSGNPGNEESSVSQL